MYKKWTSSEQTSLKKITVGMKVCENGKYKNIVEVPPYQCYRNNFAGSIGFKVQIGAKDFIEVPVDMLERIFNASVANGNLYDKSIFVSCYYKLNKTKPCYVQTIGGIFEKAGLAFKHGWKYRINN